MTSNFTKIIKIITLLFFVVSIAAVGKSEAQNNTNNSNSGSEVLGQKSSKGQVIEPENPVTVRMRNRKTPLPPYPTLDQTKADDPEYVAEMWWEYLGYNSKEEASKSLKIQKQGFEKNGFKWRLLSPGDPDSVEDHFEMPLSDALPHCSYTPGYTFPDVCLDEKGNIIFNSEIDGQEVLDKVVKKYGKQGGKYHKMPKVKPKLGWMSETTYEDSQE